VFLGRAIVLTVIEQLSERSTLPCPSANLDISMLVRPK